MRASDVTELRAFAAILRHGTFTRAAAHLEVSPSALSQTIRNLEARLNRRLLHRTTRSVAPTEAGTRLAQRILPLLDDLEAALSEAMAPEDAPAGRLRLNMARVAVPLLAPLFSAFLRAHPSVTLDLVADDSLVDIVARGFDAGIRLGERLERDMIAIPLGPPLRMAVLASPAWVAAHGAPAHPADLARFPCAGMRWPTDGSPYRWEFEKDGEEIRQPVTGPLVCEDPAPRLRFARDGLGLTYAFEHQAATHLADGSLVRLLEDWTPPFPGLFLYTPSRRQMPAALRAFLDLARATLPRG
jgi:DNA-binding transcriptional LysR family regulator